MVFRIIKAGITAGAVYAVFFLLFEDVVALGMLREEFTIKQMVSSLFIYLGIYILIGLTAGLLASFAISKEKIRQSSLASIIAYLTAFTVFVAGLELLPAAFFAKSLKFQGFVALSWLIIVLAGRFLILYILRKRKNPNPSACLARVIAISAALAAFTILTLKIKTSPYAYALFNSSGKWWLPAVLIIALGIYWLVNRLFRLFDLADNRKVNYKLLSSFILPVLMIIMPWILLSLNYQANILRNPVVKPLPAQNRPNVIFIVLDALRADHVGICGSELNVTPNIDRYAQNGSLFLNTLSNSSWTKQSVASYLTGRYPGMNAVEKFTDFMPDDLITLAEVLKEAGYYTKGISTNINVSPEYNYDQGFDHFLYIPGHGRKQLLFPTRFLTDKIPLLEEKSYQLGLIDSNVLYGNAHSLNDAAIPWLEKNADQQYFLYLHYMEPHFPYYPRIPGLSRNSELTLKDLRTLRDLRDPNFPAKLRPEAVQTLKNRYADEIADADRKIGTLFEYFDQKAIWDNSIVILTSDHGEEFFEHGMGDHGNSMFQEVLQVPLLVFLPGVNTPETIGVPVELIALAPTIYDYLGVGADGPFSGNSLLPVLESGADSQLPGANLYYGEVRPFRDSNPYERIYALKPGDYKLIKYLTRTENPLETVQLFNLKNDPGETVELSAEFPEITEKLSLIVDSLRVYCQDNSVDPMEIDERNLTREQLDRLRALGYAK